MCYNSCIIAKEFTLKLLEKDPSLRMTASQALMHRWIKGEVGER